MTETAIPGIPQANGRGALAPFAPLFATPEHQPFYLPGGDTAVLLVHGFPGTPAEMRPLGAFLHDAGCTVQGLLLPGFGPQLDTLEERAPADWITAVIAAAIQLRATHSRVVLGGLSMGAAVAVQAATRVAVDGLLLINPFWRLGPDWMTAVWPVLRHLIPGFQPFRLMSPDFDDPRFRAALQTFVPGADLSDPRVQTAVRQFSIPVSLLEKVGAAGQGAYDAAPLLPPRPILVLQGADDEVVPPVRTAKLRARLPAHRYRELPGDHHLIDGEQDSWPVVQDAVLDLLAEVERRPMAAGS